MRTRKMKMPVAHVTAKPGWSDAAVTFAFWNGKERHEAIISIESPWQLQYLRRELDKIETGWRERIERCK